MLANAKFCNEVANKQHGSSKHYQAGLLVLNKIFVCDLFYLTCRVGNYGMNDAKGCFDRILHNYCSCAHVLWGCLVDCRYPDLGSLESLTQNEDGVWGV